MDKICKKLIPLLEKLGISYTSVGGRIRIPLPNEFGKLEIGDLPANDTIIGLVDEDWHTHAEMLNQNGKIPDEEAIFDFLQKINSGEILLVEVRKDGKKSWRTIEMEPELVNEGLEIGEEVIIFNKR